MVVIQFIFSHTLLSHSGSTKIKNAGGGSRTLMRLPSPDFESGASAISPLRLVDN